MCLPAAHPVSTSWQQHTPRFMYHLDDELTRLATRSMRACTTKPANYPADNVSLKGAENSSSPVHFAAHPQGICHRLPPLLLAARSALLPCLPCLPCLLCMPGLPCYCCCCCPPAAAAALLLPCLLCCRCTSRPQPQRRIDTVPQKYSAG